VRYAEHGPPPALAPYVRCIWTLRGSPDSSGGGDPVLPDGCVEIVLNFGDRFRRHLDGGGVERQPRALIAGQLTRSIAIEPEGTIDLVGIRFQPWGAAPFLRVPASMLRDRMFELSEADDLGRSLDRVGEGGDDTSRVALAIGALLERLPRARAIHAPAPRAAGMVAAGTDSVRAVAATLGLTVRTVQQAFRNEVGMSPKSLMRISRLQRAAGIARSAPGMTLSRIALDAGYYDHAHLSRDCRDIAGVTPTELLGAPAELTDVFLDREVATHAHDL
jgi:AraC-like DNA-binding protein